MQLFLFIFSYACAFFRSFPNQLSCRFSLHHPRRCSWSCLRKGTFEKMITNQGFNQQQQEQWKKGAVFSLTKCFPVPPITAFSTMLSVEAVSAVGAFVFFYLKVVAGSELWIVQLWLLLLFLNPVCSSDCCPLLPVVLFWCYRDHNDHTLPSPVGQPARGATRVRLGWGLLRLVR